MLKALVKPLIKNTLEHWHESVKAMSRETLQLYQVELPRVYAEVVSNHQELFAQLSTSAYGQLPEFDSETWSD